MLADPVQLWQSLAARPDWRDYILPGRSEEAFFEEGRQEAERLAYFCDAGSVVVDYGCGIGRIARHLAPRVSRLYCVDVCPPFLEQARQMVPGDNVEFLAPQEFRLAGKADLVYCLLVLQHNDAPYRRQILRQCRRALKKGGRFLANFPRRESGYYQESEFVHTFLRREVEAYGRLFRRFRVMEGNLVNYQSPWDSQEANEYFLIAEG